MNKEIIDKWLENEYGVSYTRLEELHDFVIEQDLKHQEEKDKQITQLTNNWNELEKWLKEQQEFLKETPTFMGEIYFEHKTMNNTYQNVLDKMKEIKGGNK